MNPECLSIYSAFHSDMRGSLKSLTTQGVNLLLGAILIITELWQNEMLPMEKMQNICSF